MQEQLLPVLEQSAAFVVPYLPEMQVWKVLFLVAFAPFFPAAHKRDDEKLPS